MSLSILHLTDIHAGPGELRDEDLKQRIPGVEREKMLSRLTRYLHALPARPDFVAITGDLTIQGREEGLDIFRTWLQERIKEETLPKYDRFLIVPGNHDVTWKVKEGPGWHKLRYQFFFNRIAKIFPHAYLPDCDPPLNAAKLRFEKGAKLIGGLTTKTVLDEVVVSKSSPFLLDLNKDILMFGFNSTLGCGVYLPASERISTPLKSLLGFYSEGEVNEKLRAIESNYQDSLLVDAGYIGDEQLNFFSDVMIRLKKELGSKYSRLTKIALLHHHVSHLWQQQLEVKNFEATIDSAQLKQRLVEHEFDLVLHGHKHTNHVAIDGSIIPLDSSMQFSPICISSGGTIGGYPRLQDRQTFKLIKFEQESGPRNKATIEEIPLLDADPAHVLQNEKKVYPIPISSRLPALHDFEVLKTCTDKYLSGISAPELNADGLTILPGEFQIPTANPDIVSGASSYTCYRILESHSEKIFFDIFLATKELGFRQKARIYWLLSDVKKLEQTSDQKCKVVLIVGNLERTHFSESIRIGEIGESIRDLENVFQPARLNGLLEIRTHEFSQDEIERLIQQSV